MHERAPRGRFLLSEYAPNHAWHTKGGINGKSHIRNRDLASVAQRAHKTRQWAPAPRAVELVAEVKAQEKRGEERWKQGQGQEQETQEDFEP